MLASCSGARKSVAVEADTQQKIPRRNKVLLAVVGVMALLTLGVGLVLGLWSFANYRFVRAGVGADTAQVFEVPGGAGFNRVADKLEAEGLIDSAAIFKLVTRIDNPDMRLVPGEFELSPAMSMQAISDHLESGDIIQYRITIPEGLSVKEAMARMDAHPVLVDDDPAAPPEGTLLPDTYLFPRGTTQGQLIATMREAHGRVVEELWAARDPAVPLPSPEAAVILASIVEKETGVGAERAEVAGVFANRLRRGMKLQSDPTIIYGITQGLPLGRGLRRSEIDAPTPWNTYAITGLPPTPIANPGREALAATLRPADTDALYFVADGTGGHAFARTYAGHLRNVRQWRRIERERAREAAQTEEAE